MSQRLGAVLTLAGTALATGYTASAPISVGRAKCVRFTVVHVRSAGSGATTTTLKLQRRYNDGTNVGAWIDLPSNLDDVQGAAPLEGSTFEIEHAFSSPANGTTDDSFYLEHPEGTCDIAICAKVNATGQAGDSTTVYANAA